MDDFSLIIHDPSFDKGIPLATKSGALIGNLRRLERAPESLQAGEAIWKREVEGIRCRSLSATYNCMGMVFASRRAHIETKELDRILVEDGYDEVPTLADVALGDIVVYRDDRNIAQHVGVVVEKSAEILDGWQVTVMSQWGADGEYFHLLDAVPETYGKSTSFWTDRRCP